MVHKRMGIIGLLLCLVLCMPTLGCAAEAVAVENAGVQIYYRDSLQEAYTAGDKELRHYKAYELMGVDLSRYAVPEGYLARGEA